jgi:hypothetical protein
MDDGRTAKATGAVGRRPPDSDTYGAKAGASKGEIGRRPVDGRELRAKGAFVEEKGRN